MSELKKATINVTKDDGFTVKYPSVAALKHVLETRMQLTGGQINEILRQLQTPQDGEPDTWIVNLY